MVIAMALILLFWQAAAWTLPDFLMPGVPAVAVRLWHDIQTEEFRQILSGSLGRLGIGYGFALLFGIGFGLVGGVLLFFREVLKRSEEHTSELQSLMRISYAVSCLNKKKRT